MSKVKNCLIRIGFLAATILTVITGLVDLALGLIAMTFCLLSAGCFKECNGAAFRILTSGENIISNIFISFMRIFCLTSPLKAGGKLSFEEKAYLFSREGVLSTYINQHIFDICRENKKLSLTDTNVTCSFRVRKYLYPRLLYFIAIPLGIIARVADIGIGIIAVVLSMLSFGRCKTCNHWAFQGLRGLEIISTITYCMIKCFNPWAESFGKSI